jgi:hypothetical protein
MTIAMTTVRTPRRYGGYAAIAGAVLAIAGNTALLFVTPAVAEDYLSYPVTAGTFRWMQVFFAVTQALMAYGVYTLVRPATERRTRVFSILATCGFALTVPGELVLIPLARNQFDDPAVNAASAVFGLGLLLADLGLIAYGATTLRRLPAPLPALALGFGAFQLLVVTPMIFTTGFTSIPTYAAITVANLLMTTIGLRLLTTTGTTGDRAPA